ncbi:DUF6361 family protein [Spectribacter hydrogenooxidans]|uniref:DUF6361 family protein n=1 Tax=Spectribacter hydrogenoxidans TaxID=3075608 RepID=A0ABU3C007_9GAMM|nr:DUF6361 family protein [Salinisphaera sp. W335]MDT0634890.1 DUF6361 family protein [Salinisphaera sp. W335]
MESSFSWLDYSDRERRRVLDVVRSLSERDTRDELGVATVRDALADLLAPGVSTIQTRARYFLFIPWIYRQIEERIRKKSGHVDKAWVARKARNEEIDLIDHLRKAGNSDGVIGSWAGKSLQRLPSSVYWNGLREWRIRLCPWALDGYHHRLAVNGAPPRQSSEISDGALPNWHPGLPEAPDGFPEGATMTLRTEDAEYLRDRILQQHSGSLLGQLVLGDARAATVPEPWAALELGIELPPEVVTTLRHAREFSLAMNGAVLIYNLMLAQAPQTPRDEWIERYRSMLRDWANEIHLHAAALAGWDRTDFWRTVARARPQVPSRTQNFINTWLDWLLAARDPAALADDIDVRTLIENRERQLKKAQARLQNPRLLELWNGATGSGTARMNYRWDVMRTHLTDIHRGLRNMPESKVA